MGQAVPPPQRQLPREYLWVSFALAAIAGSVDGIGYLMLAQVFTSHMSGNTVAATIYAAAADWREAWRRFEPIVGFFGGLLVGFTMTELLLRARFSRVFAAVAAAEESLLIAFLILASPPKQWMVVLPAAAMGIQNALLRRVGGHGVRTSFVTGMIANTAQRGVATIASWLARDGYVQENGRWFFVYGIIWSCFAAGGIIGAFLDLRRGPIALLFPIGGLTGLIAYDAVRGRLG